MHVSSRFSALCRRPYYRGPYYGARRCYSNVCSRKPRTNARVAPCPCAGSLNGRLSKHTQVFQKIKNYVHIMDTDNNDYCGNSVAPQFASQFCSTVCSTVLPPVHPQHKPGGTNCGQMRRNKFQIETLQTTCWQQDN